VKKKRCNSQELNPRPEEQIKQYSNQLCHNGFSEHTTLMLDIAIFGTRPASCQIGQRWFKRCHTASFLPTTTTRYPSPVVSSLPPPPVTAHCHLWLPGTFPPPSYSCLLTNRSFLGCRTPTPAIESTNASSMQPPDPRWVNQPPEQSPWPANAVSRRSYPLPVPCHHRYTQIGKPQPPHDDSDHLTPTHSSFGCHVSTPTCSQPPTEPVRPRPTSPSSPPTRMPRHHMNAVDSAMRAHLTTTPRPIPHPCHISYVLCAVSTPLQKKIVITPLIYFHGVSNLCIPLLQSSYATSWGIWCLIGNSGSGKRCFDTKLPFLCSISS